MPRPVRPGPGSVSCFSRLIFVLLSASCALVHPPMRPIIAIDLLLRIKPPPPCCCTRLQETLPPSVVRDDNNIVREKARRRRCSAADQPVRSPERPPVPVGPSAFMCAFRLVPLIGVPEWASPFAPIPRRPSTDQYWPWAQYNHQLLAPPPSTARHRLARASVISCHSCVCYLATATQSIDRSTD